MKALISQKDLKDLSSGVQRKVIEEADFLVSRGFEVHIIAEIINKTLVNKHGARPVKTFKWPFAKNKRLFHAERVQKYIDKTNFDLIIGHGDIIKQDLCYIHNCVHLAHERIFGKPLPKDNEVGIMHKQILTQQKFKKLVCNSEMMRKDLCSRFNIPLENTVVIHPEFNLEKFNLHEAHEKRSRQRADWKIEEDEILVGLITSGNFKKRNVNLLIDVASKVNGAKFVVAGKNKDKSFEDKIERLGLSDRFIFAPSIAEVDRYYHAIDIFVLPAHIEEFGRSVLEAMALKKPVVVGSYVGASELLEGESREFILEDLTEQEFSSKLQSLIDDQALRDRLAEANFTQAQNFSHKAQNEKFEKLVDGVLGKKER